MPLRAPTTSAPPALAPSRFGIQACAGIVSSPLLEPRVDLRGQLLSASELPSAVAIDGPHETATRGGRTWASVPTISPAADETVTLAHATSPGGTARLDLVEVVGDVGSATLAAALVPALETALDVPACNPNGYQTVLVPGSSPPVAVTVSGGGASNGSIRGAKLFAASGPEVLALSWVSGTALNSNGRPPPALLPLPDVPTMTAVLALALSRLRR